MAWELAAVKHLVTNHTIRVTDLALRVTGSVGLTRSMPLERYHRDARAGLGHPPIDDAALTLIGKTALGLVGPGVAPPPSTNGREAPAGTEAKTVG